MVCELPTFVVLAQPVATQAEEFDEVGSVEPQDTVALGHGVGRKDQGLFVTELAATVPAFWRFPISRFNNLKQCHRGTI